VVRGVHFKGLNWWSDLWNLPSACNERDGVNERTGERRACGNRCFRDLQPLWLWTASCNRGVFLWRFVKRTDPTRSLEWFRRRLAFVAGIAGRGPRSRRNWKLVSGQTCRR